MTAYQQAIKDIHNDLKHTGRSFIAFRTELNPVMGQIVKEYSKIQDKL